MSVGAALAPARPVQVRTNARGTLARGVLDTRPVHRRLLLVLLAGCPSQDDDTDYVYTCPDVDGSVFALGTDRGDTAYPDLVSSMVPGTTQLITIGRTIDNHDDFAGTFDADILGARGIDLVRVSRNQFLLRAGDEGSACIQLAARDRPDDVTNIALYAVHPLEVRFRSTERGASSSRVFALGSEVALELATGGGHRIVDPDVHFSHDKTVFATGWDTLALYKAGTVPIDVITSDGVDTHVELDVVAKPDELAISSPKEIPAVLVAGTTTPFCFHGVHDGAYVPGWTWSYRVTNATWTTDNGLGGEAPGCVSVKPTTPGQRVELTADANTTTATLAFDVQ